MKYNIINFNKSDVKNILVISLFVFIIFYGFAEYRAIIDGVKIKISGINDGLTYQSNILKISGSAYRAKELLINGSPTLTEVDGKFNADLVLQNGYNVVTVTAVDKFNKKSERVYKVYNNNVDAVSTALLTK